MPRCATLQVTHLLELEQRGDSGTHEGDGDVQHAGSTRTIIPARWCRVHASVSGLWRVIALAAVFIIVAVAISTFGRVHPTRRDPDCSLACLAVVGVFCLFALAAGCSGLSSSDETRTISRAVVDSLPFGAVVTDRDGKISYVNAQYGELRRRRQRWRAGRRAAAVRGPAGGQRSIYRLSRAARDGRPAIEDIRLIGGLGGGLGGSSKPVWYRVAVRALPDVEEVSKPLVLVVGRGHHPRPRAAGQCLPRTAAGDRLSRSCAGRVLFGRCRRGGCSISIRRWPTGWATTSPSSRPGTVKLERDRARRRREPVDARARRRRDPHRDHRHRSGAAQRHHACRCGCCIARRGWPTANWARRAPWCSTAAAGSSRKRRCAPPKCGSRASSTTRRLPLRRSTATAASCAPTRRSAGSSAGRAARSRSTASRWPS